MHLISEIKNGVGLSLSIAKANFKLQNEGTLLGLFWYLLSPVLTFLLLFSIFSDRLGHNIPDYPVYLLLGIVFFNYFQKTTTQSIRIIRENAGIIKSIDFPREALVASVMIKNFYSHIFEFLVLVFVLFYFGVPLTGLIFYPLVFLFLAVFTLGSSLILSSIGTHVFDLENVWVFASSLIWFATPIFYAIEAQNNLAFANLFNPMYYLITSARELVVYSAFPDQSIVLGSVFYTALFFIAGFLFFKRLKPKFAELI